MNHVEPRRTSPNPVEPSKTLVHAPARRPPSWTQIIRPGQFAAFAKHADTDTPCDEDGRTFASPEHVTVLIFDSLDDARRYCGQRIAYIPHLCFEIFDAAGRTNPPLLVLVHPSREHKLTANPRTLRLRKRVAIVLLATAPVFVWFDYWYLDGALVLPTFLGINMIVIAARLLHINMGIRETERARKARLEEAGD